MDAALRIQSPLTLGLFAGKWCSCAAGPDLEIESRTSGWYSSEGDDFLSARGETRTFRGLRCGDWSVRTETHTVLTSTASEFRITADLDAFENGVRFFCRSWDVSIPHDFV